MPRGRAARAARLIQDSPSDAAIPDKLYYRIGEVSELTKTKAYVLRYWETEFPTLRPVKSKSGHRLYRRKDVELIFEIRRLLYGQGFTIAGARKHLASKKNAGEQTDLFQSPLDVAELKAIRRELQTVLTMLSRKC
jgi:DNA-binding transcriptional MerR regulator